MNRKLERLYEDIRTRYTSLCARTSTTTDAPQAMEYHTIDHKNHKTMMALASREYPTEPARGVETFTQYVYFSPAGDTHITMHDENGEHVLPRRFPDAGSVAVPVTEAVHALLALKTSWVPTQYTTYLHKSRGNGCPRPGEMSQAKLKAWYQDFYNHSSLPHLERQLTSA